MMTEHGEIRAAVRELCGRFPDAYWRELDEAHRYPVEFVQALTDAGWLAVLIPQEYGGAGLGSTEAAIVLEEVNRCGGNAAACHAQMYTMGTLLRHGSEEGSTRSASSWPRNRWAMACSSSSGRPDMRRSGPSSGGRSGRTRECSSPSHVPI
jgi:alkylation response protein AidB-like acyl-CoA dehydrogenase